MMEKGDLLYLLAALKQKNLRYHYTPPDARRAMARDRISLQQFISLCARFLVARNIKPPDGGWENYTATLRHQSDIPRREMKSAQIALRAIQDSIAKLRETRSHMATCASRPIMDAVWMRTGAMVHMNISKFRARNMMRSRTLVRMQFKDMIEQLVSGRQEIPGVAVDPGLCLRLISRPYCIPWSVKANGKVRLVVGARRVRGPRVDAIGAVAHDVVLYYPGGRDKYTRWYVGEVCGVILSNGSLARLISSLEAVAMLHAMNIHHPVKGGT